jgi:hypothetical protein
MTEIAEIRQSGWSIAQRLEGESPLKRRPRATERPTSHAADNNAGPNKRQR